MLSCRLFIVAVAMATAAAWPQPGEDALDDWFDPFFNCELVKSQDIREMQKELHAQVHQAKSDAWTALTPAEKTVLVDTANKMKPVIVETINSTCSLLSRPNETETLLLTHKVSNILRDKVLEEKFGSDLMRKVTVGDLHSIDALVEKLIQELQVVLNDPKVDLTESERNNYIDYFTQVMDIIRNAVNGLTPIIEALTLQEFVDLRSAIEKLAEKIF